MVGEGAIDVTFDFRTDTPAGKDPDAHSPTLRRYHRLLWSRPLPCGVRLELEHGPLPWHAYLHHESDLGEFWLASDTVVPTFRYTSFPQHLPRAEFEWFFHLGYTIGGMMVFPSNRIDGKMTINGARGFSRSIRDRFDLTLECIRRHYLGDRSPLSDVLARYADFFALFRDFAGYVDFFYLQDLTTPDHSQVRFMAPFDDFRGSPTPGTLHEYLAYRDHAIEFLQARNRRIATAINGPEGEGIQASSMWGWWGLHDGRCSPLSGPPWTMRGVVAPERPHSDPTQAPTASKCGHSARTGAC